MNNAFPPLNPSVPAVSSHRGKWIAGVLAALLAGAGVVAWLGISEYNELQFNDARIGFSWNQVINQYTRRSELVPNLVAVVKSYAANETALYSEIAATRSSLAALAPPAAANSDPRKLEQFQAAQNQLSGQMSRLLVVAEQYPHLKSSSLYQDLMVQLEGTENRLAYARQQYFAGVAEYNFSLRRFPGNLIAGQSGLLPRQANTLADQAVVFRPIAVDLK